MHFQKSIVSLAATTLCGLAFATTPYSIVDTSGLPHDGETNYSGWINNLSPGGGTAIAEVSFYDPTNQIRDTIAIGRYDLVNKTFTPFSLSAMGITDSTTQWANIYGSTADGKYLFNWGTDCMNSQCFNKTGLLSSDGQTSTWLTAPAQSGYQVESTYIWMTGGSRVIENYAPLSVRYYQGTWGDGSYQSLNKAYVYDIHAGTGEEVAPLNTGEFVDLMWVKSDDGALAYGGSWDPNGNGQSVPIKWTRSGGTSQLFTLPSGATSAGIRDVNTDGSLVIGSIYSPPAAGSNSNYGISDGFIWTSANGLTTIAPASGFDNLGLNKIVSDSKFFGYQYQAGSSGSHEAVVVENGTITNASTYFGVSGYNLDYLSGFSADGSVILAYACPTSGCQGQNGPTMLLLGVPQPDAVSAPANVLNWTEEAPRLANMTATVETATTMTSTLINGAHSNPMRHLLKPNTKAFWVTGDVGTDNHGYRSGDFRLGELNLGYNYGKFQVNYSLGRSQSLQKFDMSGEVKTLGNFVNVEAIIPLQNFANRYLTIGAFNLRGDALTSRGYDNNGTVEVSTGKSAAKATGLRARIDWVDAMNYKGAALAPYADISAIKSSVAGYTEVGGAFPATFEARKDNFVEMRVGTNASMPLKGNVTLKGNVEAAFRNKDSGPSSVVSVANFVNEVVPGNTFKRAWVKAGVGIESTTKKDHKFNVMLNTTTQGPAASAWISANYQVAF